MAILNSSGTITIVFLLFFSMILVFNKWKTSKCNSNRGSNPLPPGPPSLPLIGHLHLLIGKLPFRAFATLSKTYGGIMLLKLGQVPTVIISSREISKEALKTHGPVFAGRPDSLAVKIVWYDYKSIVFGAYNDHWRQMRKIAILKLLGPKQVRSILAIRKDEMSKLVNSIRSSSGSIINVTDMIFKSTSSIACRAAYGKVFREKDGLIELMEETLGFAGGFMLADMFPSSKLLNLLSWDKYKLLRLRRSLDVILDRIIDEHRVNLARLKEDESEEGDERRRAGNGEFGNEDLVDVLIRVQESGEFEFPIDNERIKAIIFDIFVGGTDTISTTLDWIMVECMRNPHVMAKAQAEVRRVLKDGGGVFKDDEVGDQLKYLKLVMKESLRLHPPTPFVPRASRQDCEINGYHIPAKARVLVNTWGMGRNPHYFPDPESFRPERFEENDMDFRGGNYEYVPFGAGTRMCPGMTYASTGIVLQLAHMLYHFNWQLPPGMKASDLDMIESHGLNSPRKHHLHIVATPYNISSC